MRARERDAMIRALRHRVQQRVDAADAYSGGLRMGSTAEQVAFESLHPAARWDLMCEHKAVAARAAARASILEELLIASMERERDEQDRAYRERAGQ